MDLLLKDVAGNGQSQRGDLVELDKPDQRFNVMSGYWFADPWNRRLIVVMIAMSW